MLSVFFTLLAGVFCQLISNSCFVQVTIYEYNYALYKITISVVYLLVSSLCVKLAFKELVNGNNDYAILASMLCVCMLITSMFNVVMIDEYVFYALTEYKSGDGLSWKNIYFSIEMATLIIVSSNGFKRLFTRFIYNLSFCESNGGATKNNN